MSIDLLYSVVNLNIVIYAKVGSTRGDANTVYKVLVRWVGARGVWTYWPLLTYPPLMTKLVYIILFIHVNTFSCSAACYSLIELVKHLFSCWHTVDHWLSLKTHMWECTVLGFYNVLSLVIHVLPVVSVSAFTHYCGYLAHRIFRLKYRKNRFKNIKRILI